ncbi:MAG: nitrate reductase molybdenum cofactor assembly chaperone [Rudaea sp.]
MNDRRETRRLFRLLSQMLEYPNAQLSDAAEEGAALAAGRDPEAALLLGRFARGAASLPPGALEEAFTQTFELNPERSLYVGYHLFGESYKRSLFLLGLKERYDRHGIDPGAELPDHLALMLRYISRVDDAAEVDEIIGQALVPALDRILAQPEEQASGEGEGQVAEGSDVYVPLLRSVRRLLAGADHDPSRAEATGAARC